MITYRTYRAGDESALLQLWNETMPLDPLSKMRFRRLVLLDPNFDPQGMQLAFDSEQLIGCVYAVRRLVPMLGSDLEQDKGWIPFFFVALNMQRKGIGRELMERALQFLKETNRNTVFFAAYAPNYILPGIDEQTYPNAVHFLKQLGFSSLYSPVAMDLRLQEFHPSPQLASLKKIRETEGYSFSCCHNEDIYPLIQFATDYNSDWGRAIREGFMQAVSLRQVLIVKREKKIVGFCLYGGYEGVRERFGPFGVDDREQGKGLGAVLLHECLQQMKQDSLHGAWFLWTSETSAAGKLYKRFGFKITRRFHVMQTKI